MGKLMSLLSGAGQGYLAAKRYQDTTDRNKKQDDLYARLVTAKEDGMKKPMNSLNPTSDPMSYDPFVDEEDANYGARKRGMAHGGMVSGADCGVPMPVQYDKMSWQRQSFKK